MGIFSLFCCKLSKETNERKWGEWMKKRSFGALLVIMLVISLLAGCGKQTAKTDAEAADSIVPVTVAKVKQGSIARTVSVNGILKPQAEASLAFKTGGKVAAVAVKVGDAVKQGQTLISLETDDLALQVAQAEASLEAAQDGAKQAEVAYRNAKLNLERMQYLFEQGAIAQQQLEQAELQLAQAEAQYNGSGVTAQQKQAQVALELARNQLHNATLVSPIAGLVTQCDLEVGEMASPGVPVATVMNIDKVKVEANVTESVVNKLQVNQQVKVKVDSIDGKVFTGVIRTISPAANTQTKVFPIEIEINNPQHLLKPGMFARVELELEKHSKVLIVPKEAVVKEGNKQYIFVVDKNKIVHRKAVTLGISNPTLVEVKKGLKAGESVITSGQYAVSDGKKVSIQQARGE